MIITHYLPELTIAIGGNDDGVPPRSNTRSPSRETSLTPISSLGCGGLDYRAVEEVYHDVHAEELVGARAVNDKREDRGAGRTSPEESHAIHAGGKLPNEAIGKVAEHAGDNGVTSELRNSGYMMRGDLPFAPVIVALQHQSGILKGSTDEIYVQASSKLPVERRVINGEERRSVQLSQLLPAALENASTPTKSACSL